MKTHPFLLLQGKEGEKYHFQVSEILSRAGEQISLPLPVRRSPALAFFLIIDEAALSIIRKGDGEGTNLVFPTPNKNENLPFATLKKGGGGPP